MAGTKIHMCPVRFESGLSSTLTDIAEEHMASDDTCDGYDS